MEYQFVISGEIGVEYDWWTGQRGTTTNDVRNFLNAHRDEDVQIAVSSPGGYVDAGLEIYQLVKDHGKVHMHIIGMTASAATFLTMGAKSVDMVDGSLMLIHNASTSVVAFQTANKEQLDELIANFQKEREDLNTIDKVIASLYSKKCGKSLDDCLGKMKKAAWISPDDALEFGLIDEIREDENSKVKNSFKNKYSNNILKEFGLPPFPQQQTSAVDADGNPTKSFIQKSVDAIKSIFANNSALTNSKMIKIFKNVMSILDITDGFNPLDDGTLTLTQEQMKTVDERLGTLEKDAKDAKTAKDALQTELDKAKADLEKANKDLKAANDKLETLKKKPGEKTNEHPEDTEDETSDDFNALNAARESFNLIKDL